MKKRLCIILGMTFLMVVFLGGCGSAVSVPDDLNVPAVSVSSDGTVRLYLVDEFERDYYDVDELRDQAQEEIDAFAAGYDDRGRFDAASLIDVRQYEVDGIRMVMVEIEFSDQEVYTDYSGYYLFYGTVEEAQAAGYSLNVNLVSVEDESTTDSLDLAENGDDRILIVEDAVRIYVPGQIKYITEGAILRDDGSVDPADESGNTYILMK